MRDSDGFCSTACEPNAGAALATFKQAYPQTSTQFQGVTLLAKRLQRAQMPKLQSTNTKSLSPMEILRKALLLTNFWAPSAKP
jgi:hypothetical protein